MAGLTLGSREIGQVMTATTYIPSSSSGMYQKTYSPTNVFATESSTDGNRNVLESYQTYSYDDIYNISLVLKGMAGAVNHYRSSAGYLIRLQKNSSNYLNFAIEGYNVKLTNVKNGTTLSSVTVLPVDTAHGLNKSAQYYAEMNLHEKYVTIKNILNNQLSTICHYDFSDFDTSALNEFNIMTRVASYNPAVMMQHFRINSAIDEANYLSTQFEYGRYNVFETTQHENQLTYSNSSIRLGGTLTYNTDYKKIADVTQTSLAYYALGVYNQAAANYTNMISFLKFKITSGTASLALGAGATYAYVLKDGDIVGRITSSNSVFTPENDVEYTLFIKSNRTVGYTAPYGLKAQGTFTIEAWDPYLSYEQAANYCAETCNGSGFTGAIPMVSKTIVLNDNGYSSITVGSIDKNIPIFYKKYVQATDKIAIFTGNNWKYIS